MGEIEKRMQLATAYRTLLDKQLFDKQTEISELIEMEIKEFVHGKLETILGVRPAENPAVHFSGMEILTLKTLARKLMEPKKERPEASPQVEAEVEESPDPIPEPVVKKRTKKVPVKKQEVEKEEPVKAVEKKEVKDLPPNVVFENGRYYEMTEVGGKKFAKDITRQATSADAKPTPSLQEYEAMMYTNAMRDLSLQGNNPLVSAAVAAAQTRGG
jgi:outer membrane biosynthesis protein TonB